MKALPVAALLMLIAAPAGAALTEGARLAAVYDAILDAQFDRVDTELSRVCPPAPSEACQALAVESLWWRILVNPESRALDDQFTALAARAIAASEAWTRREPRRGEAWFYLAGSYGPLVQWRVLRRQYVSAAREGKAIKAALERALALDPTLDDAYFGIGVYHYYAGVAPATFKMLRWLLLLPGGDRVAGLREMVQGRDRGQLLRGEADYQLHLAYLRYEGRPDLALAALERLDARYPGNPLFLQRIAEIRDRYLRDRQASANAWRRLLDRARAGSVYNTHATEVRARLGLASALTAMNQRDAAAEHLQLVIDMRPIDPIGALAEAEQRLRDIKTPTTAR
ncbi:MAG: hypothetical protein WBD07_18645 [Vicinamibacterales bacterium]